MKIYAIKNEYIKCGAGLEKNMMPSDFMKKSDSLRKCSWKNSFFEKIVGYYERRYLLNNSDNMKKILIWVILLLITHSCEANIENRDPSPQWNFSAQKTLPEVQKLPPEDIALKNYVDCNIQCSPLFEKIQIEKQYEYGKLGIEIVGPVYFHSKKDNSCYMELWEKQRNRSDSEATSYVENCSTNEVVFRTDNWTREDYNKKLSELKDDASE